MIDPFFGLKLLQNKKIELLRRSILGKCAQNLIFGHTMTEKWKSWKRN